MAQFMKLGKTEQRSPMPLSSPLSDPDPQDATCVTPGGLPRPTKATHRKDSVKRILTNLLTGLLDCQREQSLALQSSERSSGVSQAAAPARLLLVEDDLDILFGVQVALEGEGYAVTSTETLPASLKRLEEHTYQLVLTDLFSPYGHDPLKSIRPLLTQAAPTPVAVMTAWPVSVEAATQAGVAWMMRKPFNLDDLLSAVQQELHPRRRNVRQTFIVEQFFAALNARDWNRAARFCTPELVVRPLSAPAVVLVGFPSGLLTYRALMEQRFSALPGYTFEEVQVFRRPVGLAVRYMARWEDRAGVVHHLAGSQHFRFEGGRIAQIEGAF